MEFFEILSFAKLFSQVSSGNITMSDLELETAAKLLKDLGDNAPNFTPAQREIYKMMVDMAKDNSKGHRNG